MLIAIAVTVVVAFAAFRAWRRADDRALDVLCERLEATRPATPEAFEPSMVENLPAPARQFFRYAISPGTPIRTVAEIEMRGEIGLGTRDRPNYLPMRARQLLAAPYGFVWRVEAGRGGLHFSGSDGADESSSWSRFWLLDTVPVMRAGGGPDHRRAAFGRLVGEAVFWTPAALLPRDGVSWAAVDESTARVTVTFQGLTQTVDLSVARDGQPKRIVLPRWTNANPGKVFRLQPFGGELHDFRTFDGYRLPTRVEAGNMYGTDDYFPFFKASVDSLRMVSGHEPATVGGRG